MRYGKKSGNRPWTMTCQLRQEPVCPGCAEILQPVIVEIRDGWAWCPICVAHGCDINPLVLRVLKRVEFAAHSTIQHGVRFYTPKAFTGKPMNALDFYQHELTDDRVELTAIGRQALKSPNTTQQPKCST